MARNNQQRAGKGRPAPQGGRGRSGRQGKGKAPQGAPRAPQRGRGGRPLASGGASRSDLIEGRRAVEEALAAGMPLKSAMVAASAGQADPALDRIVGRLEERGVSVEYVPRTRLDQLSSHGAHQGIVVRSKPFEYAELADVIRAAGNGDCLIIGAAGVVIANARAAKVGVGAYKTSTGAVLHIPIAQVSNLARAVERLKEAGFWACASTEHAEADVWGTPMGGRLALVMGSEGSGISRLVLEKCDFAAKLPQRGRVESLNVAQATTVMAYEWLRRVSTGA